MTILVAAPYVFYRLIVLDPVLCDAFQQKGAVLLEQMAWAQVMERLVLLQVMTKLFTASTCTWHTSLYILVIVMCTYDKRYKIQYFGACVQCMHQCVSTSVIDESVVVMHVCSTHIYIYI